MPEIVEFALTPMRLASDEQPAPFAVPGYGDMPYQQQRLQNGDLAYTDSGTPLWELAIPADWPLEIRRVKTEITS